MKSSTGASLTGTFSFTFRIYATSTGGVPLWSETQPAVTVDQASFAVQLGSVTPFPVSLDFNQPLFLTTEVNSDGEMSPRVPINSVAYAFTTGGINSFASAPASAVGGRMYYDTTNGTLNYYNDIDTSWHILSASGTVDDFQSVTDAGSSTTDAIQFNGGTSTGDFVVSGDLNAAGGIVSSAVSFTGGFIDGTAIGSITPSTGSFTDISADNAEFGNVSSTTGEIGSLSGTSLTFTNATLTKAILGDTTSTNLYATNATFQNLTINGSFNPDNLTWVNATGTNTTSTNLAVLGNVFLPTDSITDATVSDTISVGPSGNVNATAINSGVLGNAGVTLNLSGFGSVTGTISATHVSVLSTNIPGGVTSQDTVSALGSIGVILGGDITSAASGTVSLAAGRGLFGSASSLMSLKYISAWAANPSLSIPSDNAWYFVYEYFNAGNPSTVLTTTDESADSQYVILGEVLNPGDGEIHIHDRRLQVNGATQNIVSYLNDNFGNIVSSGCVVSVTGVRNLAVSACTNWYGLNRHDIPGFDSSASGTFDQIYGNGSGGFVITDQAQWDNQHYDNGTGTLAPLGAGQFGVHWIYTHETGDEVDDVFGDAPYATLEDAEAASAPTVSELPEKVQNNHGFLIGAIVFQQGAGAASAILDLRPRFGSGGGEGGSTFPDHNDLSGLQGGMPGQYYHLTQQEHTFLTNTSTASDGAVLFSDSVGITYNATAFHWDNTGDVLAITGGITATDVTSTNLFATSATIADLTVTGSAPSHFANLTWDSATGTNTTSTNLAVLGVASLSASTTINGTEVCLLDGTNCPSGTTPNLQTVTNTGNVTTNSIIVYGGITTSDLTATGTTSLQGTTVTDATATNVTTTNLYAANGTVDNLSSTTGTITTLNNTTLNGDSATFNNVTSTNIATTQLNATSATIADLVVTSLTVSSTSPSSFANLIWTNATGTNTTSTNLFVVNGTVQNLQADSATTTNSFTTNAADTNLTFTNGTSTAWLGFATASGTNIFATNLNATSGTINNFTSQNVAITGGSIDGTTIGATTPSTAVFTDTTSTDATTTNLFASNATIGNLTVTNLTVSSTVPSSFDNLIWTNATGTNTTSTNLGILGFIDTDLNPSIDATLSLGSPALRWNANLANVTSTNLVAVSMTSTNAFISSLMATTGTISALASTSATIVTLNADTLNGNNATFNNVTSTNATTTNLSTVNETAQNLTATNATLTNLVVTNLTVSSTAPSSFTNLIWTNSTGTNTTSTNLFANNATITNLVGTDATFTALTITGAAPSDFSNIIWTNATGTNTTSTNLFAINSVSTNGTITNGNISNLTFANGTSTSWFGFATASGTAINAASGNISNLVAGSLATPDATITGGSIDGSAIGSIAPSTGVFTNATSNVLFASDATFSNLTVQNPFNVSNLTWTNATGTNTTSTNLFVAGTASTTQLFANNSAIGSLTAGSESVTRLTATSATTTNATTTNFGVTGVIDTNLNPSADSVLSLGSPALRWNGNFGTVTTTNLIATNETVASITGASGTINLLNTSILNGGDAMFNNTTTTNAAITNETVTNGTTTNLFATNETVSNFTATTATITNLTVTNITVSSSQPSSFQNLIWVNATGTNTTSTNLFAANGVLTNGAITNGNVTNLGFGNASGTYIDFNASTTAPAYQEGRLFYDDTLDSLAYYNDITNETVDIGQDQIIRAFNNTGSTITAGSVVYVTGSDASADLPTIALAQADSSSTASAIGVVEHAIPAGTAGDVLGAGTAEGIDTSGFSEGDTVYLSATTPGALTDTPPDDPNVVVAVAVVTKVDPTDGDLLVVVSAPRGGTLANGGIAFGTTNGFTADDPQNLFWDETNKRLGIGTDTPSSTLQVVGLSTLSDLVWGNATGTNTTSTNLYAQNANFNNLNYTSTTGVDLTITGQGDFNNMTFVNATGVNLTTDGTVSSTFIHAQESTLGVSTATVMNVDQFLHVGIGNFPVIGNSVAQFGGTTNTTLQVNSQNHSSGTEASTDYIATNDIGDDTTYYVDLGINSSGYNDPAYSITGPNDAYLYSASSNLSIGTASSDTAIKFHAGGTTAADEVMRITSDHFVGIGTTNPSSTLDVVGDGRFSGTLTMNDASATTLFWEDATGTNLAVTNQARLPADTQINGTEVCLLDGTDCPTGTTPNFQTVTNTGNTTTNSIVVFGGITTSNLTATGTTSLQGTTMTNATATNFAVTGNVTSDLVPITDGTLSLGSPTLRWNGNFNNTTSTNATTTNLFATNATVGSLTIQSAFNPTNLTWVNATGTNTTSTNLAVLSSAYFATSTFINNTPICLADGTNCPSGTTPNFQTVTNTGNTTTNAIQFNGGTSTGGFLVQGNLVVSGTTAVQNITGANATFTNMAVTGQANLVNVSSTNQSLSGTLTVAGASSLQGLTFTNATGGSVTTTNLFVTNGTETNDTITNGNISNLTFANGTSTSWFGFATASGTTMNAQNSSISSLAAGSLTTSNATISGGSIDGTPIGAITPSTGVFTSVTSTNATTTNLFATNATIANLTVGGTTPSSFTNLIWVNATGTNTTSTNLFVVNDTVLNDRITNLTVTGTTSLQGTTITNA
ncbi:MAG: hypothetical protein WA001_04950, partial [Patescibacteria group bacterium]